MADPKRLRWAWTGALAVFVLAGLTGAGYRLALALGTPGPFALTNVRHAHSHLMYFGWGTPALMALVARHPTPRDGRRAGPGSLWRWPSRRRCSPTPRSWPGATPPPS